MNSFVYGLLVLATTALMGSSFAVGKIGLSYVSPLLLVGIRFILAGLLMACIFISLRTITASESSILTFVNPLLVVIFGTLFTRARYRVVQWLGVLLGFTGVSISLGFHLHLHFGTWLGLLGAVSWSVATLLIKR